MKFRTLKSIGISSILLTNLCSAQGNWKTFGNGTLGLDPVNAASFLGTTNNFPLQLRTTQAQPINFQTNNIQRMTIDPAGLVGVGSLSPLSMLHVNSIGNTILGETFSTTGPNGSENRWRMYTGSNNTERFRIYRQTNNNVFFQTTTNNARYGIRTGDLNTFGLRMLILGQNDVAQNTGRVVFGNNLPENFAPQDRMHLHQDNDQDFVRIRYSNSITGVGNNDGSALGIVSGTGEFRLTQFEDESITFFTNSNLSANQASRIKIASNGQLFLGAYGSGTGVTENVIDGPVENNFTDERTALLNVRGPIYSCYPVNSTSPNATVLYGFTDVDRENSPSINDGFRMKMARNYFGLENDALIFEKSDEDDATVDGGIVFTNTASSDNEIPSLYIRGTGRTYVGKNILTNAQMKNRFTIDSEWNAASDPDASKSGLRFIDLTKAETPIVNPNPDGGVLGVDEFGNVIYVKAGGVTGIANANNGLSVNSLTGNVVLGNDPGGSTAQLINNREIPMNGKTIDFKGEGTVHISQSGNVLNPDASLDVNNQTSTNTIGINFSGIPTSNNSNQKGILATMNVLNSSPTNNSAVIEASNTQKYAHAAGWIIKANGYYGTDGAPDLADQASFGVLGNGNVMVNGNLTNTDNTRANFVVNDFTNSNNNGLGGKRSMYVSNTHSGASENYGLDVFATNDLTTVTGIRSIANGNNASQTVFAMNAEASSSSTATGEVTGLKASAISVNNTQITYGIRGYGNTSNAYNAGVRGDAISSTVGFNIGVDGLAQYSSTNNIGLRGKAEYGNVNYGIYGTASGGNVANYGVYGEMASGGNDRYAAYFKGRVGIEGGLEVSGNITMNNGMQVATVSDQNLKISVNGISEAMHIINSLNPKTFYFDTLNTHGFDFTNKKQYGFIAQDVEQILPELIVASKKSKIIDSVGNTIFPEYDYKALNYNAFIGILTQGMKEQQAELDKKDSVINDLNTRLSRLESCLSALLPTLCEMNQSAVQQTPQEVQQQLQQKISVTLSNRNTLVLSQNVPNPFAEKTVIAYNVPSTVQKAQLIFYDGNGQLINSVDILERGNGELTVFANDLSSGMYTYSLVADGKVVATKKMMKN